MKGAENAETFFVDMYRVGIVVELSDPEQTQPTTVCWPYPEFMKYGSFAWLQ